jgi:hypothetical protein
VPETPNVSPINLLEVSTRAEQAHNIITGFALTAPILANLWRQVSDALSDIPVLTTEILRLHDRLAASRIDCANLAAAGRITITAYHNDEPDPFAYLLDELRAQGFGADRGDA